MRLLPEWVVHVGFDGGGAQKLLRRAPNVTGFTATVQFTLHYLPEPESKGLVERLSIRNGG